MFDPFHKWLGIPKDQRPPTHYQLLGIAPGESDLEVIEEAAIRQTTHVRAYQTGPHAADCTRLLNEIAQARTTLTNPAKRKEYDAKLGAQKQALAQAIHKGAPVAGTAAADAFADLNASPALPRVLAPRADFRRDLSGPAADHSGNPALVWGLVAAGGAVLAVLIVLIVALSGRDGDSKAGGKDSGVVKADKVKPAPPPRDDGPLPPNKDADLNLDVKKDSEIEPRPALKAGSEWNHVDLTFATVMDGFVRINSNPRVAMGIDPQRRIVTRAAYSGPLEIGVVARTADENIRIQAPQGAVIIFNWEANRNHLAVHRPDAPRPGAFGSLAIVPCERLKPDRWYALRWRILDDGMEISVDGKVVFAEKRTYTLAAAEPVAVGAMRSPVDVKSLVVKSAPRLAKKENPPVVLPGDTPLDRLDAANVPPEDRHAPFGDSLVAVLKGGHSGEVFAVEFAPNGKWLASTGRGGQVIVWSLADAEPMRLLHDDKRDLAGLAFSPDSAKLGFATQQDLRIFEVGKWDSPWHKLSLPPSTWIPTEMAWSRDGKALAYSRNGQITLLDMSQDPPGQRDAAERQNLGLGRMNFTADGQVLATSAVRGALLWDCTAPRPALLRRLDAPSDTKGTAISPDGKKLVMTCMNLSMRLYDLDTNRTWDTEGQKGRITFDSSARFSPDGKTILTTGLDPNGRPQATWRSAEDLSLLRDWILPERSSQVAFDASGRYAAFTSHNRKIYILRLPAPTAAKGPAPAPAAVAAETISRPTNVRGGAFILADERHALLGGHGLALFDLATGQTVKTLQPRPAMSGTGGVLAVAPGDRIALSASPTDKLAYCWDLSTGELKHVLKGHDGHVQALAISRDGSRALTGSGGFKILDKKVNVLEASLRLWDLERGVELGRYTAHGGDINAAVFLGPGLKAVTGGKDGTICVWDFAQTKPLLKTFKAHTMRTLALAAAADGQVLSAGGDKKVRLWDIAKGQELDAYDVPVPAYHLAVDAAGRYAAAGSGKQILVYDLRGRKEIANFPLPQTVRGVSMAPSGRFVVATSLTGNLNRWRVPASETP